MKRWLSGGRCQGEAGQATFEFLVVVPFVFIFLFFMVEGTNAVKTWMLLEGATREGARCGAVNAPKGTSSTPGTILYCVSQASGGLINSGNESTYATVSNCSSGCTPAGTTGQPVQVAINNYPYSFLPSDSPLARLFRTYLNATIPAMSLSAQTQMRLELQSS